jgi:PAS domain S-box-containing protein
MSLLEEQGGVHMKPADSTTSAIDITERKQAEEALKRYQLLSEHARDIILFIRRDGRIIEANAAAIQAYGYTRQELLSLSIQDLRSTETQPLIAPQMEQAAATGILFETTHRRKDGSTFPVEVSSRGTLLGGEVVLLSIIRDITERRRATEQLRASEELFRQLAENIREVFWIRDLPGRRMVYVNPGYEVVWGRTRESLLTHPESFMEAVHPDDFARVMSAVNRQSQGEYFDQEYRIVRPDGQIRWIWARTFPICNDLGQAYRLVGIAEDITERKQADEKHVSLAKFPSENPHPVLRFNHDGLILYANAASQTLLRDWGCAQGDYAPAFWRDLAIQALASQTRTSVDVECGEQVYAVLVAPIADAGYVNLYGTDITARKRAEEALCQRTNELQERNEELDTFAHTVAHDLKTPLSLVIGYAELAEQDFIKSSLDDLRNHLRVIARNGRKMDTIIEDLLLLAEVRSVEAETEPIHMANIVAEVQERLALVINESQAEIILPAASAWPVAWGYAPWVEEVWANYLSNALKYGGQPPRVELGATTLQDGKVRFWVRDNGPGLAPEDQARLFMPFARLGQARAKGHGLGLSIARRIVEKLGGEVSVESQVGQGSVFSFTLPGVP